MSALQNKPALSCKSSRRTGLPMSFFVPAYTWFCMDIPKKFDFVLREKTLYLSRDQKRTVTGVIFQRSICLSVLHPLRASHHLKYSFRTVNQWSNSGRFLSFFFSIFLELFELSTYFKSETSWILWRLFLASYDCFTLT